MYLILLCCDPVFQQLELDYTIEGGDPVIRMFGVNEAGTGWKLLEGLVAVVQFQRKVVS